MPPYEPTSNTEILKSGPKRIDNDNLQNETIVYKKFKKNPILQSFEEYMGFQQPLIWLNVIVLSIHQILGIYYFFVWKLGGYMFTKFWTSLWMYIVAYIGGLGVTAGAHRYWTHRSYKAKLPLQIILMLSFTVSGENSIFDWVRDHRVHHRYSETDADPHNANRGLFFSHIGWLMMKKHPEVYKKGREVDLSDILNDPIVRFQRKYFQILRILLSYVIPTIVPVYFWNEEWKYALISQLLVRYIGVLNITWSVNSFAHLYGNKPYDKRIGPVENKYVGFGALGEGWHNYHHTFPWDYKTSEFGNYRSNLTCLYIDAFSKIGWAYDLRTASQKSIDRMKNSFGEAAPIK